MRYFIQHLDCRAPLGSSRTMRDGQMMEKSKL